MALPLVTQEEGAVPIPTPTSPDDLGPCIRALRREGYDDEEERVAICMGKYEKAQGGGTPPGGPPARAPIAPPPQRR
jgi:hypothetical protein